MTRVIERCATCGVEHEVRVDECEACGGALRWWCRTHSSQIGWLESAECRRCVEEKARPVPRPRPAPPRAPATRPVAPVPPRLVAPVPAPIRAAGRDPLHRPMRAHEWVGAHMRAILLSWLLTMVVCVAAFALRGVYLARLNANDVSDFMLEGGGLGGTIGFFAGIVVAGVRVGWLKRRGGPLDPRKGPV